MPEKDTITEMAVRSYFQRQQKWAEQVKSIIERLREGEKELVVWGTGSYVMSLLATTNLSKCNIKGFVDNNKIKQGRKMYGYTIYPPVYLEDKSYTILVCSMLNGQQIKEQIEKMYTKNTVILL